MAKSLLKKYIADVWQEQHGESYRTIFNYFWPEFITALILSSLLHLVDSMFIASIKSTSAYATLGVTSTLLHFLTKIAEGLSVGTMILCGQYNGIADYKRVGRAAISGFWLTVLVGGIISIVLFIMAPSIYMWYQVPEKMIHIGARFLRLRAISVFLSFLFFACIGFLRGVKNTRLPMQLFMLGGLVFIVCDYLLIFGVAGFPRLKLYGSAIASIAQYTVMLIGVVWYILRHKENKLYVLDPIQSSDSFTARNILALSWPVMIDKAVLAGAKMWLAKLIGPMGKTALASFTVIKDMEQLAFVPAVACAQVITFLVSNDYGRHNWLAIKTNIKKILFCACIMVFTILMFFSLFPQIVIQFFDTKKVFGTFAAQAFPLLSILVFFDVLQLILAGALRGASDVKTVMLVRLTTCVLFFCPCSYILMQLPIATPLYKFVVVYGSFYLCNGIMSIIYIQRFRGHAWKYQASIKPSRIADDQDFKGRDSQTRENVPHSHP